LDGVVKLALGGYCMVGASNAFNQIIEKDLDALMDRTKNRPVPGRMSSGCAYYCKSFDGYWCITLYYQSKNHVWRYFNIFIH
jgi:protoheme IX farnesyltransferase